MDRTDKYSESADKLKKNALALLAQIRSEITMSLLGVKDHARTACGSESYISGSKNRRNNRREGHKWHTSFRGVFTPVKSFDKHKR